MNLRLYLVHLFAYSVLAVFLYSFSLGIQQFAIVPPLLLDVAWSRCLQFLLNLVVSIVLLVLIACGDCRHNCRVPQHPHTLNAKYFLLHRLYVVYDFHL